VSFPPAVTTAMTELFEAARDAFHEAVMALEANDPALAAEVNGSREVLRARGIAAIDALGAAFRGDMPGSQEVFRIGVDMVGQIQGIHRLARRLADGVRIDT
jgi:hypothetical protein